MLNQFARTALCCLSAVLGALCAGPAGAATVSWTNSAGGNWSDGSNWSTGLRPTAADTAAITLAGTYTVTLDLEATVAGLSLGGASGTQTLQTSANTLTLNGPGTINPHGALNLAGGTFTGSGLLTVNGAFTWSGGNMTGTGTTRVSAGKTMIVTGNSTLDLGRPLVNAGTIRWTGSALTGGASTIVTNQAGALFDCAVDQATYAQVGSAPPQLNNSGTFRKSGGTDNTALYWVFNNNGTVQVQTGFLFLNRPGSSTGLFDTAAGAQLVFNASGAHLLNPGARFQGAGRVRLDGGTLTLNTGISVPEFVMSSGTLNGASTFTSGGLFTWYGGRMEGLGKVVIPAGRELRIGAGSTAKVLLRRVDNSGLVRWAGGDFIGSGQGTVFNNFAGAEFDCEVDQAFAHTEGGVPPQFNNAGLLRKTEGGGNTVCGFDLKNTGTVRAQVGNFSFTGAYTQTAGSTILAGGSIQCDSVMQIQGGVLTGSGTVAAAVSNAGRVRPGASPGVLSIGGNYTQTAAGSLDIEIGGTTLGTQYDRLDVAGTATLAGKLNVQFINGFAPAAGDAFPVLLYSGRTGTFSTVTGLETSSAVALTPNYNANNLTLGAVALQPDLHIKKGGDAASAYGIDNTYQETPDGAQIVPQSVDPNGTATYNIRVQNDSTIVRKFVLKAWENDAAGWAVVYKVGATNITTALKGAGYATASIAPAGSIVVTLTMTPSVSAPAGGNKAAILKAFASATDATVRDAVEATTSVNSVAKPDLLIKKGSDPASAYATDNRYQTVAGSPQMVTQGVDRGMIATYHVQVQNDGNAAQPVVLKATETAGAGWTIGYRVAGVEIGPAITSALGYTTAVLAPGASLVVTLTVRPGGTVYGGSTKSVTIGAYRDNGAVPVSDVVLARAAVNVTKKPDLLIKAHAGAAGTYANDNVYQTAPAGDQIESQGVATSATVTYDIRVQNDGSVAISPVLKAVESDGSGWVVLYKVGLADITAAIKGAAGYTTKRLVPGATVVVTVAMTPDLGTLGLKSSTVNAFVDAADTTVRDAVQAASTVAAGP